MQRLLATAIACATSDAMYLPMRAHAPMRTHSAAISHMRTHVAAVRMGKFSWNIFKRQKDGAASSDGKGYMAPARAEEGLPTHAPILSVQKIPEDDETSVQEAPAKDETKMATMTDRIAPITAAVSESFAPLWTLEDRDDGWNDVRTAIKDRQKPWKELKRSMTSLPAYRWAKVLANEAKDLTDKKL